MAKKKVSKKKKVSTKKLFSKPVEKEVIPKKIKVEKESKEEIAAKKVRKDLNDKRYSLIGELKGKLMSNSSLRQGGSANRSRYAVEQAAYKGVIEEINSIGVELGIRQVGLGTFRN